MIKWCYYCQAEKPISEFSKDRTRKSGLNAVCNSCRRIKGGVHTYKISKEKAKELYSKLSCEICGTLFSKTKKSGHIDHDHRTGKVRGVLCVNCNSALGKFRDSPEFLTKAIHYLTRSGDDV